MQRTLSYVFLKDFRGIRPFLPFGCAGIPFLPDAVVFEVRPAAPFVQ